MMSLWSCRPLERGAQPEAQWNARSRADFALRYPTAASFSVPFLHLPRSPRYPAVDLRLATRTIACMSRAATAIRAVRLPLADDVIRPTFRRERAAMRRGVWPVAGCDEAGR